MKINEIVGISFKKEEEKNPFYDPYRGCNGGGYHQPLYTFCVYDAEGNEDLLTIRDSSCGDFGTRFNANLGNLRAYWGSMLESREEYSDFTWSEYWMLEYVRKTVHIRIPINEDIKKSRG